MSSTSRHRFRRPRTNASLNLSRVRITAEALGGALDRPGDRIAVTAAVTAQQVTREDLP